jgi:mevalonate kinase
MIKEALFHSKILLFGEYGIIQDSMALSIPYKAYMGELKFEDTDSENAKKSNGHLVKFRAYLADLKANNDLPVALDLDRFKSDIESGMHFDSTIPQGYGVGSSGALVAAIYNRYAVNRIDPDNHLTKKKIIALKSAFGKIESYFHGTSSGIDPLICYLKLPVLIKSKKDVNTIGIPEEKAGEGAIFLMNTGSVGETQSMVNIFMERMKHEGFREMIKKDFKKYNDLCISAFLEGDTQPLFDNLKQLSSLVLQNFKPMIPTSFHQYWEEGLKSNAYYLKLCGSGGGGYILGFTRDFQKAQQMLHGQELEVIYTF